MTPTPNARSQYLSGVFRRQPRPTHWREFGRRVSHYVGPVHDDASRARMSRSNALLPARVKALRVRRLRTRSRASVGIS